MKLEHWMTEGLRGATGTFQRAAREYAEGYAAMAVAAERERCAKLCEGAREAASHSSDGLKRAGAMSMATSCAKLICGPNVAGEALP